MIKPMYFIEIRFGQIIKERLARTDRTITSLANALCLSESAINEVFNGECSIGKYFTFGQFDRFFQTKIGYFASVYENCKVMILKEVQDIPLEPECIQVPFDLILDACHLVHEMYRIKDRLGNGCNRVFENKETGQSVSVSFYRMNDINGNDDFAKVKYGEFEINYKAGMVRLSNYKLMASYFAYHLGKSE